MEEPFSAWREGAPYYVPLLVLGVALLAILMPHGARVYLALPVLLAGVAVLCFFRDPHRVVSAAPSEFVSPADGTVVAVEDLDDTPYYDGPCRRVSIFLSVLSVHVNRAPYDGVVRKVEYKPGRYKNAMNPASSQVNESNAVWLDTLQARVTVRQISGAVARRIVCKTSVGDSLRKGEKFGMIKLGSRTELYLPNTAEIRVSVNDRVRAGATVLGRFPGTQDKSGE
ncbi:MAG TPA: phosphatidylserine decarboxylase family protein [Candidatus Hydrogenedentes bacterium]|nr:phosphatidylserine decarboxylase family protein [Candidatus Hydrogenedentota bacterium]HPG67054.1 phosphatidylserine decarboxylase family protein [Candidatus Hydrogenedentota bacterium]